MAKFQAMMDMLHLVVPFIERDGKGQILRDQTITFNTGNRVKNKVYPATFSTNDPEVIKYLRAYGGNQANGGASFREIVDESAPKKAEAKKAPETVSVNEAVNEVTVNESEEENAEEEKTSATEYPDVTTAQQAGIVLRGLFPGLTARDTNNKEKIFKLAEEKGISFPNLK